MKKNYKNMLFVFGFIFAIGNTRAAATPQQTALASIKQFRFSAAVGVDIQKYSRIDFNEEGSKVFLIVGPKTTGATKSYLYEYNISADKLYAYEPFRVPYVANTGVSGNCFFTHSLEFEGPNLVTEFCNGKTSEVQSRSQIRYLSTRKSPSGKFTWERGATSPGVEATRIFNSESGEILNQINFPAYDMAFSPSEKNYLLTTGILNHSEKVLGKVSTSLTTMVQPTFENDGGPSDFLDETHLVGFTYEGSLDITPAVKSYSVFDFLTGRVLDRAVLDIDRMGYVADLGRLNQRSLGWVEQDQIHLMNIMTRSAQVIPIPVAAIHSPVYPPEDFVALSKSMLLIKIDATGEAQEKTEYWVYQFGSKKWFNLSTVLSSSLGSSKILKVEYSETGNIFGVMASDFRVLIAHLNI